MAEAVTAYNLPRAKAWLSEDDVRRKGTQQGYVRKRGPGLPPFGGKGEV